jgi:hypothetical protein
MSILKGMYENSYEESTLNMWQMRELVVAMIDLHKGELIDDEIVCLGCGGVFIMPCPTTQLLEKGIKQWDN